MENDLEIISSVTLDELLKKYQTDTAGLKNSEVQHRLNRDGLNILSEKKRTSIIVEFLSHFLSPLILILLGAGLISAYLGETKNFYIISVIVLMSVILDFVEEHSANNAAEKLKEKVSITATVIRDGKQQDIHASQVCIGDVIFLSSGDLIPADARVFEADDFFVNESSLTGESFPQEKYPRHFSELQHIAQPNSIQHQTSQPEATLPNKQTATSQYDTLVFLGSSVISGTAKAIVIQTGQKTMFGQIATKILNKKDKGGFELGIANFGVFIMKVVLAMSLFVFLVNSLLQGDMLGSFIFAVSIAVGVTPELLPAIMSITLARGSQRMAKVGIIVKRLSAIPNFGSMDILCTDKTGTLTEDKISLKDYTNIAGQKDENIFLYMYLNSYFQTGVKNPFDHAVINHKSVILKPYTKAEEIPFDFVRKMGTVVVRGPEGLQMITRGAPETVLTKCTSIRVRNKLEPINEQKKSEIVQIFNKMSAEGLRVLAIATKNNLSPKSKYTTADESELVLEGFVSFSDTIKTDVSKVLEELHNYGVEVKIITGDNELVAEKICKDAGLSIKGVLLGHECDQLDDSALAIRAEKTSIFARFSPNQKNRVIIALKSREHIVGYMGDGINDAPSLKSADIGISVNNATDIAKESADIILTSKHLSSIVNGVLEGRKTFANTMKYIMMGLSSNFGNMFSVLGAVIFLPFLPMLPIQILLNNFIYDCSQVAIPSDNVDRSWLAKPHKWSISAVKRFMLIFGPISSVFDFASFFLLFSVFHLSASAFQTGWFLESLATQTLVIHIIRTRQIPFLQSNASKFLTLGTLGAVAVGWILPYTPLAKVFQFTPLPAKVMMAMTGLVVLYLIIVEITKRIYYRRFSL